LISVPGTNTSLLRTFANYGRKKFYNIGLWWEDPTRDLTLEEAEAKFGKLVTKKLIKCRCYKTFFR
jgi:hypothetical protein